MIKPDQLGTVATRILHANKKDGAPFPLTSVIQSDAFGKFESQKNLNDTVTATYEAFVRIEKSGNFSVLPIPVGYVELSHERDILYICAHAEPNKENNFLEIYFLTGYGLGEMTIKSVVGDVLFNSVKVAPVSLSPIGFNTVGDFFGDQMIIFKLLAIPFDIAGEAQSILLTSIKNAFPAGVERIIMTNKDLKFSSGVNLSNPEKALINYRIDLGKSKSP
ncbi:MAG: hypothetical protein ACXVCN_16680 [Bdellovibrio sp.]